MFSGTDSLALTQQQNVVHLSGKLGPGGIIHRTDWERGFTERWYLEGYRGLQIWGLIHSFIKGLICTKSSAGKEFACNEGDPGSIPGLGRSPGEFDRLPTLVFLDFPSGSASKESTCNVRDLSLIAGLGRFPGEGKGDPLQYSCLENSLGSLRVGHNWATFTMHQSTRSKRYPFHHFVWWSQWNKQVKTNVTFLSSSDKF